MTRTTYNAAHLVLTLIKCNYSNQIRVVTVQPGDATNSNVKDRLTLGKSSTDSAKEFPRYAKISPSEYPVFIIGKLKIIL